MSKECKGNQWIRKYRLALLLVLIGIMLLSCWYCISTYQKNKIPKEATLVKREEVCDEGEA